jgi:hypothetical protein
MADIRLIEIVAVRTLMEEVFKFAASFKEYPPRAFPPSFNPTTILDETLRQIKVERKLREAYPLPAGAEGKPKE